MKDVTHKTQSTWIQRFGCTESWSLPQYEKIRKCCFESTFGRILGIKVDLILQVHKFNKLMLIKK